MRQGVKFHDGSLFNADAVIWNLERALNDKSPQFDRSARALTIASLWPIVAYRKLDDWHVELQTDGVNTVMPSMLNRFLIASPAQWEQVGRNTQEFRRHPSGTGPWKLKSFTPQQQAELLRNEDYWDKARVPKSARMLLFPMPDASARAAALLSGAVDWAELPAPDTVDTWSSEKYVSALRHDPRNSGFNADFRQLLHVGYKVAAKMGEKYLQMLDKCEATISRNVTENLFERHIRPLFLER